MTERRDELEYEDLEETFSALRDYLLASDVVAVAESDQADACEVIASLFAVVRHAALSMRGFALVLRRQPATAEGMARGLDELAAALEELVLGQPNAA